MSQRAAPESIPISYLNALEYCPPRFYYGSRKRKQVHFTPALRAKTKAAIDLAFHVATQDTPPLPLEGKLAVRCHDCSLIPLCLPDEVRMLAAK